MDLTSASRKSFCGKCGGTACYECISGFGLTWEIGPDGDPVHLAKFCKRVNRFGADQTGIPSIYAETTLDKVNFKVYNDERLQSLVTGFFNKYVDIAEKKGAGLYLWSRTPGTGKTMIASSLARSIQIKHHRKIKFITAADYLQKVKDSFGMEKGQEDPSEIYRKCPLLVLDDMGAHKSGAWADQEMFRLIDTRAKAGNLVTIFTANADITGLPLWDRTKDRIAALAVTVHFPEFSLRRQAANEKAAKLAEEFMAGSGAA